MLKHLQTLEKHSFLTTKVHVETSPDAGKHSFLTTKVHVETSSGSGKPLIFNNKSCKLKVCAQWYDYSTQQAISIFLTGLKSVGLTKPFSA